MCTSSGLTDLYGIAIGNCKYYDKFDWADWAEYIKWPLKLFRGIWQHATPEGKKGGYCPLLFKWRRITLIFCKLIWIRPNHRRFYRPCACRANGNAMHVNCEWPCLSFNTHAFHFAIYFSYFLFASCLCLFYVFTHFHGFIVTVHDIGLGLRLWLLPCMRVVDESRVKAVIAIVNKKSRFNLVMACFISYVLIYFPSPVQCSSCLQWCSLDAI